MRILIRKILISIILYFIWPNIWFLLLINDIYNDPFYLIGLILYYLFSFADVMIRPMEERGRDALSDKYGKIMALLILSSPIWFCVYVYEYRILLVQFVDPSFSVIGVAVFIAGNVILLTSRIQLGRFASAKLKIQEDHELFTSGIYKYIRNPIYTGGLLTVLGMGLIFRSLVIATIGLVIYTYVLLQRIAREEELLEKEFGDAFIQYKKGTKRLIPLVY
ncbi:MAG: methyltransferase family protein [Candidatus Odinarchaeota archaeon]